MEMTFEKQLKQYQTAVEEYLATYFQEDLPQKHLFDAMRYSLLAGGKRIRPVLVLEFCRICGGDWKKALPFAAAIEMIHTYSLIHDDLPCMDNDDYRRGKLTNHKVFGEAQAVLAGDALLTASFRVAAFADAKPEIVAAVIRILSTCAGEYGMVGGQILDIEGENQVLSEDQVYNIHRLKTGALISAACQIGATSAGATEQTIETAAAYAQALGLAFQIRDDMLDQIGDAKKLGKAVHADTNKNTFVRLYGLDGCRMRIDRENEKAVAALQHFPDHAFLLHLTELLASRDF